MQRRDIRRIGNDNNKEGDIPSLAIKELRDSSITYHLPRSDWKSELIACIATHMLSLSKVKGETLLVENEVEN